MRKCVSVMTNKVIVFVTGASVKKEQNNETMQHNNFISLYFPVHGGFTHNKNDHLIYTNIIAKHSSTLVTMVIRGSQDSKILSLNSQ